MEEEIDGVAIENTTEDTDLDTVIEAETIETEEAFDWKAEAEKNKQIAENQRIRAEKAESDAKKRTETQEPKTDTGISSRDTIALINAKVHEDDVDDVVDYAKYKKISIADALKSGVIRASLSEKNELRNTANATNTGKTRSGRSNVSGDSLLTKAQKTGEVPDSDEGMNALLEARYSKKK